MKRNYFITLKYKNVIIKLFHVLFSILHRHIDNLLLKAISIIISMGLTKINSTNLCSSYNYSLPVYLFVGKPNFLLSIRIELPTTFKYVRLMVTK